MSFFRSLLLVATATALSAGAQTTNTTETIPMQEVVEAALYGKTDTIDRALKQGYKVDTRDAGAQINMVDNTEHFSALMWAAAEGQDKNVELLLKNGADMTLQDVDGDTAESFAAKAGHTKVVEILKAASKTAKPDKKETPAE